MHRLVAAVAAACLVSLAACSNPEPEPLPNDATVNISRDTYLTPCRATVWITGVIVTPEVSIQDDNGVVYGLMWGARNTARIQYGKRYTIGGKWFGNPGGTFWACAGAEAVIPQ